MAEANINTLVINVQSENMLYVDTICMVNADEFNAFVTNKSSIHRGVVSCSSKKGFYVLTKKTNEKKSIKQAVFWARLQLAGWSGLILVGLGGIVFIILAFKYS